MPKPSRAGYHSSRVSRILPSGHARLQVDPPQRSSSRSPDPDYAVSEHYDVDSWFSSGSFAEGFPFCLARSALASATRSLNCSPASEATSDSESNRYIPPLTSSLAKGRNADPTPERKSVIGIPSSASTPSGTEPSLVNQLNEY